MLRILVTSDIRLFREGVAAPLGIGLATVKDHVHSILGKPQLDRRGKGVPELRRRRSRTWFREWRI